MGVIATRGLVDGIAEWEITGPGGVIDDGIGFDIVDAQGSKVTGFSSFNLRREKALGPWAQRAVFFMENVAPLKGGELESHSFSCLDYHPRMQ